MTPARDLVDVVHISVRHEDFHIAFRQTFIPVAVLTLSMAELLLIVAGTTHAPTLLVVVPALVCAMCAAATALMCVCFPFDVGPDGICAYDCWCRRHHARWDEVVGARRITAAGLDYLLIDVRGQRPIWIPLFVPRQKLLRSLLLTYAGDAARLQSKLHSLH